MTGMAVLAADLGFVGRTVGLDLLGLLGMALDTVGVGQHGSPLGPSLTPRRGQNPEPEQGKATDNTQSDSFYILHEIPPFQQLSK
ncbi:hypothetical protein DESUT3_29960 [Desulfuromonas versatilis]|uniref:Uncharacterized protein n=1 Tax=Desulfuromonas versatilis TaxID=2802975 RepID=A0ABM8HVH7_9BACT|nr:hypothetical protein DESUT3_29960 [Desulfuromonas versatilis]